MTRRSTRLRDAWRAGYDAGWRAGTDHETPQHPRLGDMSDDYAWIHGWHAGNRGYRDAIAEALNQTVEPASNDVCGCKECRA